MSSPAKQIRDVLTATGLYWPIYVGSEPTLPDNCVTLYDTGGSYANQDAMLSDPALQIRVRSFSYMDGYEQCAAIRDALIVPRSFQADDWIYTGFWLTMDISKIGRDDADRELFTCNLRAMRQPVEFLAANDGTLIETSTNELIEVAA